MNKKENLEFITKTESLVNPEDVTAISFLGDFNKFISKKSQDKIMKKGSEQIPYMGFIVDPYCLFLSYEIKDIAKASEMLPNGYELVDSSIFANGEKRPIIIASAFSARTSAFIGMRLEFYIIARNKETGLVSWIIADYETNTNSHDPKNGFCGYTTDTAFFTTTPYGELIAEFKGKKDSLFSINTDLKNNEFKDLDQKLWVEGNLSIDYGGFIKDDSSEKFSLIFDPILMKEALEIQSDKINTINNTFFNDIIDSKKPLDVAVFPYSQHFIIKQDLKKNELNNETDLKEHIDNFLKIKEFKTMSGNDIKKPIIRGMVISSILNISIILFLVIKLISS